MTPMTALDTVRSWPIDARLDFVFDAWDQLVEDGWQPEATEELFAELDRRLEAHAANPSDVRSWEQIVARVRKSP